MWYNNKKDISCKVTPGASIQKISNDGVIVTIKAKKVATEITGYYFSYTNKRPNKNNGGYLATNKESIDVVRLPGTTYVWVEDKNGKITNISYCINNNGIIVAIIIEYEVDGENKDVNLEKSHSNKMLETIRQKGTVKVDEEK